MHLDSGTRLGPYEIVSPLGAGGMGEVCRARDTKLDREVAIKILRHDFAADPERLRRFQLEAHAASSLNHPNIITIYDIGTYQSIPYIAMEYVEGKTLRELLKDGPLPSKKLLRFACQITEGLTKAHSIGVVHRDLKPENLMVTQDGYIKILDFGLAKLVSMPSASGSDLATMARDSTSPGVVLGSVGYMSPEQARGLPAGFHSDLFSFGSILYEMTTGERAFEGSSAVQTMSAIIEKSPTSVASLNPDAPPPLQDIVERCLAKEPADRYLSTAHLWQELEQLREHLPVATSQVEVKQARALRRKVGLRALAVAGVVVALFALIFGIYEFAPLGHVVDTREAHAPHLAIATFKNLSGDSQSDFFSEGFTEAVMSRLMSLDGLHIVSQSDEIGAPFLLEGSVQKQGDRVRVTYRLSNRNDDVQLGGDVVDGRLEDIFDVQDRVAAEISGRLRSSLGLTAELVSEPHPTDDVNAYSFYLEGRGYLRRVETGENLDMAIGLFDKALELDPSFALAYAGLGEAYWEKYDDTKQSEWIGRATEATERALALDDSLSPVHTALGTIYLGTGKFDQAVASFDRAIALDKKNDDAYRGLAAAYEAQGSMEKAEATYQHAIEVRPDYWGGYSWLGGHYFRQGRYEEATHQLDRITELTPENHRAYSSLGGVYHLMGRFDEAEDQALELASENANVVYDSLLTFELVGERARAMSALEQTLEHGYSFEEMSREPELVNLRKDPRYLELLNRR